MVNHSCFLCLFASLWLFSSAFAFDQQYKNYDQLLKAYVDHGRVNYQGLKENPKELQAAISEMGSVKQQEYDTWSRDQQLAFWINAYNAWMLKIVIDHYPVEGVKKIPGVWDEYKLSTAGRNVSLNEIEHKILREQFKEPRIHCAIVCASIGCPELKNTPYLAASLNAQLDEAARAFVNNSAKVMIDTGKSEISVSKIFDWFKGDFGQFSDEQLSDRYGKDGGVIGFLMKYLPPAALPKSSKITIRYLEYDWNLNKK